jgi:nucleoid-associated protein YgaU
MIKKTLLGLAAATLISMPTWAEEVMLKSNHPDSHTVVKGDTLWDISDTFLQNPWMWPEIWQVNPQIDNPHLIYPGDVVRLIYLDGKARLTVDRGDGSRTYKLLPSDGITKLSPQERVVPSAAAIPAIPLDAVDNFLSKGRIVTSAELDAAAYVVQGSDGRLIVGAGDELYARGTLDEDTPVFGVYRRGKVYKDPVTNEILGLEALDIGTVKLRDRHKDISTMEVTRTTEEIRIDDRLLPFEERAVESTFYPSPPEEFVEGVIMDVEGGVSQVGKLNVVMINRGDREGLEEGNVLAIYKRGETIQDRVRNETITLPDERAGLLMIFRTFEKMSYGLVLEASKPLTVNDKVKKP